MLGSVKRRIHVIVGLSVVAVALLALVGLVGESQRPEKIEQLQVVVSPEGDSGARITETIDQDFGTESRHGPQLVVPNDLGQVQDVTASSPDAPAAVHVDAAPFDSPVQGTRIRVGDADRTVTGQHRYVISYVLPNARFASPMFALDVVGADSAIAIEHVTVVFRGISLDDPTCSAGGAGATGGCSFEPGAPLRLAYPRLAPHEGITVRGEVTAWRGGDPVKAPPLPDRRPDHRAVTALLVAVLGAITATVVYFRSVRTGSNEVVGSGAADAAHGASGAGAAQISKVSDAELAELSTVEFAPPKGIAPWQGAVVLTEVLDDSSVTAWFSGAIADDVLAIESHGSTPRLSRGPKADGVDAQTDSVLRLLFGNREVVDLNGYDPKFGAAWKKVQDLQDAWVASCGWWTNGTPRRGRAKPGGCATSFVLVGLLLAAFVVSAFVLGFFGVIGGPISAVVVGIGLPLLVARVAYSPLRPARTANGSAYALQTESFRKFLVESEGQYVQWAWKNGLLRQYSAWAVALDAADAWRAAMEAAGVPPAEIVEGSPLLVHSMATSFTSSHTEPVSTSSSGGSSSGFSSGGFSGSVGGGGGGGSHGSW